MNEKEKQIQEYKNKMLIDELSKMSPQVIATAYLYAINYTLYGEDVTEKWETADQNVRALGKAYRKGYHDALQKAGGAAERSDSCTAVLKELEEEFLQMAETVHYYKQKENVDGWTPMWHFLDGKEVAYKSNAVRIQEILDKYGGL